jgi:hypothetical protein
MRHKVIPRLVLVAVLVLVAIPRPAIRSNVLAPGSSSWDGKVPADHTILVAVSRCSGLVEGAFGSRGVCQMPLMYAVPFCVPPWGALSNSRRQTASHAVRWRPAQAPDGMQAHQGSAG